MVNCVKKKTFVTLILFVIICFAVVLSRLFYLQKNKTYYENELSKKTTTYVNSYEAPRGRILDCNGKVIVDNTGILSITYRKLDGMTRARELEIAHTLVDYLDVEKASREMLVNFYILEDKANSLITEEENQQFLERKLTLSDLEKLQKERITDEMLTIYNDLEKEIAIYYLMNKGYSYDSKILQKDVSESVYHQIIELNLPGIIDEVLWKREYPYGEVLKNILGRVVNGLPQESASTYLSQGYSYSDSVGISYLEAQYEAYLKGEKAVYRVGENNTLEKIKEAVQGNDLILSIDIEMQIELETVLQEEIINVKKRANTEYFTDSYAIISDPNTGAIKAISGQRLITNNNISSFQDVTTNIITASFTSGSIVKGASMTVGYLNNAIAEGKKVKDSCVKLYLVPAKCSWKSLGYVDDITALATSSNYFQFLTAIGVTGQSYSYNMELNATEEHFNLYRDVFALYGLGMLTGIDLPNEKNGIIGNTISDDLLLNLAIGQYDTYTPIQLMQYINTLSLNGYKKTPSLMQSIVDNQGNIVANNAYQTISHTGLSDYYYDRIKSGLNQVFTTSGTANGYLKVGLNAAGKTGTSETFIDTNGDNIMDKKTISTTLAFYAPFDNPKYSMVIVSPNISHYDGRTNFQANINRMISKRMTEYLFQEN